MMVTMLSVSFVSCGDDDEGNSNPTDAVTSAKIGDIYYSDGTCSSVLASGKKPIGIVVYVGSDAVSENKHGLVMALRNSGKKGYDLTPPPSDRSLFPIISSFSEALSDYDGLEKTKWLEDNNSSVAKSVIEYTENIPAGTSGWFIPSLGQWLAAVNAFGAGVTTDGKSGDSKFLDAINSALAKVGADGIDYESVTSYGGSGQAGYFQTSSYGPYYSSHTGEQTGYGFCYIKFGANQNISFGTNNGMSSFYIRPFLAF